MPFKFDNLLSPETRERMRAERAELGRLHGLPDRWLAEALLNLARTARSADPRLGNPHEYVYGPAMLWQVVPELARRLGGKLLADEGTRYRNLSGQELREIVGCYLKHADLRHYLPHPDESASSTKPSARDLLDHDFVNGNPLAIAVDRIHPAPAAGLDKSDWIALHMREVSGRRGHGDVATWSPIPVPEIVESANSDSHTEENNTPSPRF